MRQILTTGVAVAFLAFSAGAVQAAPADMARQGAAARVVTSGAAMPGQATLRPVADRRSLAQNRSRRFQYRPKYEYKKQGQQYYRTRKPAQKRRGSGPVYKGKIGDTPVRVQGPYIKFDFR